MKCLSCLLRQNPPGKVSVCKHLLHPKNGGRLQPIEYTQAAKSINRARLRDITPIEAKGRVITKYRSIAITMSVIIEQIPNRAPQNAYNSQPVEREREIPRNNVKRNIIAFHNALNM